MTRDVLVREVLVPMRDGVELVADTFVPVGTDRLTTLLFRTPYQRGELRHWSPVDLARAGWRVVVQSVRGRNGSGGTFDPFHQEVLDGFDTVLWCRNQEGSNGKIALFGASYVGYTQWAAASARPAGLAALVPFVSSTDVAGVWFREGGAFRYAFAQGWAQGFAYTDERGDPAIRSAVRELARGTAHFHARDPRHSPLFGLSRLLQRWHAGEHVSPPLSPTDVPVLLVTGWYDIFCQGAIDDFRRMRAHAPMGKRLWIGPWSHDSVFQQQVGERDFGLQANGLAEDLGGEILSWVARIVAGEDPGGPEVRAFVMGANRWVTLDDWPPRHEERVLHLAVGRAHEGRLLETAPSEAWTASFRHDPADPVTSLGGRRLDLTTDGQGPRDQRRLFARDDMLWFLSEPLGAACTIGGPVRLALRCAASAAQADVVAHLVEVSPDGRALGLLRSPCRARFEPGRTRTLEIALGDILVELTAGQRLGLGLSGASFPEFDMAALEPVLHAVTGGRLVLPLTGDLT